MRFFLSRRQAIEQGQKERTEPDSHDRKSPKERKIHSTSYTGKDIAQLEKLLNLGLPDQCNRG
jgi:hypothetical protein